MEGCNAGAESKIGRDERLSPFGIALWVSSGVDIGVSGFRPPTLPFSCEGWMVAVDEFAVRGCLCPYSGLGNAVVAVCVETEEVEELRERDALVRRVGATSASECWPNRFMYFIAKT